MARLPQIGLLCLALAGGATLGAQTFVGFAHAGGVASQLDGDMLAGYNRLGLVGGVGVWSDLSDKWRTSIKFSFAQNGSTASPREAQRANGTFLDIKLDYVTVPVSIHYMDWLSDDQIYYRLEFVGGLEYRRLISSETIDFGGRDISETSAYRPNGLGLNLGAYYSLRERTAVGVFHHWGILNANERRAVGLLSKQFSLQLRQAF